MNNRDHLIVEAANVINEAYLLNEMQTESLDQKRVVLKISKEIKKDLSAAKKLAKTNPRAALKKYDAAIARLEDLQKKAEQIPDDNPAVLALIKTIKYIAVHMAIVAITMLLTSGRQAEANNRAKVAENEALRAAGREKEAHERFKQTTRSSDDDDFFNTSLSFEERRKRSKDNFDRFTKTSNDAFEASADAMKANYAASVEQSNAQAVKAGRAILGNFLGSIGGLLAAGWSSVKAALNDKDSVTVDAKHNIKISSTVTDGVAKETTVGGSTRYETGIHESRTLAIAAIKKLIRTAKEQRGRIARSLGEK